MSSIKICSGGYHRHARQEPAVADAVTQQAVDVREVTAVVDAQDTSVSSSTRTARHRGARPPNKDSPNR